MDEKIIYIIFIVLSLVYSVYKKKQKQNAQNNSRQPVVGSGQPVTERQLSDMEQRKAERAAKVKNMLDKMLLGEEFTEESKTKDEVQIEEEIESIPTEKKKYSQKQINLKDARENASLGSQDEVKERYLTMTEEEIKPKDIIKPEEPSHRVRLNFNLRQAVINSIILEKKY